MYHMDPLEILEFLIRMLQLFSYILIGDYDYAGDSCVKELAHFKESYSIRNIFNIGDVGMEDYFLILHLIYSSK